MTPSCALLPEPLRAPCRWLRARWRRVLLFALVIAAFYALGYFTPRIATPGSCLIYG